MKKFKCSKCGNVCGYVMSDFVNMSPVLCPRGVRFGAEWREDESMQGNNESMQGKGFKDDKGLPEWVKLGAVGYYSPTAGYCKIEQMDDKFVLLRFANGNSEGVSFADVKNDLVEARKRPFNAKEMRMLVGNILENDGDCSIVIQYSCFDNMIKAFDDFLSAEELFDMDYTVFGKPCCKFEHLENGVWVE